MNITRGYNRGRLSDVITEQEYDNLKQGTQRFYIYCPLCNKYYLRECFFYHPCQP